MTAQKRTRLLLLRSQKGIAHPVLVILLVLAIVAIGIRATSRGDRLKPAAIPDSQGSIAHPIEIAALKLPTVAQFVADELIVKYKNPLTINAVAMQGNGRFRVEDISSSLSAVSKAKLASVGAQTLAPVYTAVNIQKLPRSLTDVYKITLAKAGSVKEATAVLTSDPNVEYVQPNYYIYPAREPNDPGYKQQWEWAKIQAPCLLPLGNYALVL